MARSKTPIAMEKQREKAPAATQMTIICYNCNKKGHYATNCPEKAGVQGYALEVIEEDDQEETPQELPQSSPEPEEVTVEMGQEDQEDPPEGDQYDPDDHQDRYQWSDLEVDQTMECGMLHVVPIEELEGLREDKVPQLMAAHIPEKGATPSNSTI